jgi:hypothetical protein
MADAALCRRLEAEEEQMRSLMDQVLAAEPDAVIPWTGRQMAVAKSPARHAQRVRYPLVGFRP